MSPAQLLRASTCRSLAASLAVLLGGCLPRVGTPTTEEVAAGKEWLAKAEEKLLGAKTAEWKATLTVTQGVDELLPVGTHHYHFHVRDPGRVHWIHRVEEGVKARSREAWYNGFKLYERDLGTSGPPRARDFGEDEDLCLRISMVCGGLVGWELVHRSAGGLVPGRVRFVGEGRCGGRPAVIVDHEFKIGGICGQYERFPGCRVWIDRERKLFLKREYAIQVRLDDEKVPLRAMETFSDWELNAPIPDRVFHVEGMGPPDPIADLPRDPEAFERMQTADVLGLPVEDFPGPEGPGGCRDLPPDRSAFPFHSERRRPSGPDPKELFMERREVIAKEPDGSEWVAFCGRFKDGGGFPSTRINRRHRYGGGSFHPADIYIGKRVDGEMRPVLFFRDVGSHDTSPHDFAIDGDGRFHLAVADVDIGQNNRLEVYWLVGDPKSRRWKAAWLVDHRRTFTYAASPRLTSWDHHMQLVWFVERPRAESREEGTDAPRAAGAREAREEPSCTSIYHVAWKPAGFGPKVRVIAFPGAITGFDVAQDPRTGTLLIAFSTGRGISLIARSRDGRWSRVEALDPSVPCGRPVSVAALGDGRFVIRAGPGWMDPGMVAAAEWLLIPGPAQE